MNNDLKKVITHTQPMTGQSDVPIYVDFKSDINNINPYHIKDGNWGGFGMKTWFTFNDLINIPNNNVYEKQRVNNIWRWVRCWDDKLQTWRDVTNEEITKLPFIEQPNIRHFDKIVFPVINKKL